MISRLPFALPPRGSPARLPFLLLPVLAAAAVVQLAIPSHPDLPVGGTPARIGASAPAALPPTVVTPPAMASRDPFVPVATQPGAGAASAAPPPPPDPLGGAIIAGVVQYGNVRLAVVQCADGTVRYLAIGGRLAGWRLDALTPFGARLSRGRHRTLTPAYGAHPSPPPAPGAPGKPADDQ